MNRLTLAKM